MLFITSGSNFNCMLEMWIFFLNKQLESLFFFSSFMTQNSERIYVCCWLVGNDPLLDRHHEYGNFVSEVGGDLHFLYRTENGFSPLHHFLWDLRISVSQLWGYRGYPNCPKTVGRYWMILATTSQDLQRLPHCVDAWIFEAWDAGKTYERICNNRFGYWQTRWGNFLSMQSHGSQCHYQL